MATAPDRLPLLSTGTHFSPDDGACLMELVSLTAGLPWSDESTCTDPTLATIARVVNDELSGPARQSLNSRVVDLIGRVGDPAWLAPKLVAVCLEVAQRHLPHPDGALDRRLQRADRRLAGVRQPSRSSVSGWLYRRGPAQHAITAMVMALRQLNDVRRDRALLAVLDAAIAAVAKQDSSTGHDGTLPVEGGVL